MKLDEPVPPGRAGPATERWIEPGSEAGWRVIDVAVGCAARRLAGGLVSAYAIGSLAHGGFRRAVSDVDLALLTDEHPMRDIREIVATIAADVRSSLDGLGDRLSVFHAPWRRFNDPPTDARFPPIDRSDLVRYGVLVHGTDLREVHARAPSAEAIRRQAVDFALRRVTPRTLAEDLQQLARNRLPVRSATKIVLWPVRLQHVCDAGEATGNTDAVAHYLQIADARHPRLVRDALAWRDEAVMHNPDDALSRINDEIRDLHAEVFGRLGRQRDIPRHHELAERGRQLVA
jgi:predicted nucleotidyltransferase